MKFKKMFQFSVLIFAITFSFFGCGSDSKDNSSGNSITSLSSATYAGADPKGDFIAIEIDGSAETVTHYNYTLNQTNGPYNYTKATDPNLNGGFSNMYMTEVFDTNMYAAFVIVDGVAIIFQLFDNNGTPSDFSDDLAFETPGYAFTRLDMTDLSGFKDEAFNWIKFKMDTTATEGNFEAGFAGFDTAGGGLLYGAAYNNRAEIEGWPGFTNGVNDINQGDTVNLDAFIHNASTMSHSFGDLTFIPNQKGDSVLDFGLNNGAGYAIRQADTKDWQSSYNGTYFMMVYHNDSTGSTQSVEPMKLVLSMNGNSGHFTAYDHGSSIIAGEGDFTALEDLTGASSPGGTTAIKDQFAATSGCAGAASTVVQNAYKGHGGFVSLPDTKTVLFIMMDPDGDYFFFTMLTDKGTTYEYNFGFGVK